MNELPTILSAAESTHYLVGMYDAQGNLGPLPPLDHVVNCLSLSQAKTLIKGQHYDHAELIMETAYDEMCGLSSTPHVKQLITIK